MRGVFVLPYRLVVDAVAQDEHPEDSDAGDADAVAVGSQPGEEGQCAGAPVSAIGASEEWMSLLLDVSTRTSRPMWLN